VIRLSSAETDTDTDTEAEATETDERREALLAELTNRLGDDLLGSHIDPGHDLWIRIPASAWRSTLQLVRDDLGFHFFEFLSAIDWMPSPYGRYEDAAVDVVGGLTEVPDESVEAAAGGYETGVAGGDTRFQVFARVIKVADRDLGLIVKADVPPLGDDPDQPGSVESVVAVYAGASWHEREIYEMFGIGFEGHQYLEPLYLPSDFEGHPLRKDYPLLARIVKPWPGIVDVEPMPDEAGDDEEGDES
jgi:NADH-quinone oxidoreductase subunit C